MSKHATTNSCDSGLSVGAWRTASYVAAAVAGIVVVYLLIADTTTLWDRDEPRFARAAVEMVRSGDYMVPTFNDRLRPDKPAMIYWLMSGPIRFLGATELAVRLPSVAGLALACLLTFLIGRRMFDSRTGLRAMLILASTMLAVIEGTAATADATLLGFITLSLYGFVEMVYTSRRWWPGFLLALALGGAMLTKGPVGLAIPLLTITSATWFGRRYFRLGRSGLLAITAAVVVGCALFCLWAIPANAASGGELASQGLGRHVWQRIFSPLDSHGGSGVGGYLALLGVYVPALIIGFFPWTMFLPLGFWALWRGHIGGPGQRIILWSWMAPTFVLMSLVATKLPHYIFPIFPAASLMSAAAIEACVRKKLPPISRNWLSMGVWFFVPMVGVTLGGALVGPFVLQAPEVLVQLFVIAAVFGLLAALVLRFHLTDRVHSGTVILTLMPAVLLLPTLRLVVTHIEKRFKPAPVLAEVIKQYNDGQMPVYMAGYEEASLVFYIDAPAGYRVEGAGNNADEVASWLTQDGPLLLVITEQLREKVEADYGPVNLTTLFTTSTINYSARGREANLLVMGRGVSNRDKVSNDPSQ